MFLLITPPQAGWYALTEPPCVVSVCTTEEAQPPCPLEGLVMSLSEPAFDALLLALERQLDADPDADGRAEFAPLFGAADRRLECSLPAPIRCERGLGPLELSRRMQMKPYKEVMRRCRELADSERARRAREAKVKSSRRAG